MSAAARSNCNSGPRRSPKLKNIHMISDKDSDGNSPSFKRVKIGVPDLDEILSPSTAPVNVASVFYKDGEQGFDDISLKDLRTRCKSKNWKASKVTSDVPDMENQNQSWNTEDNNTQEEFYLDKPLIALKQKRQKSSPSKANKKIAVLTPSLCAVKEEDTTSETNQTPAEKFSLPEAVMYDSVIEKLERIPTDSKHSTVAVDCTTEIFGEEDCCPEAENPVEPLVNCEKPDVQDICSGEAGAFCHVTPSCPHRNCFEYSSAEFPQVQQEDDRCKIQPCLVNKITESAHVSDQSCELTRSTEACNFYAAAEKATYIVSPLDLIDEVSDHQKTPEDMSSSDTDRYSTANGFSVCFVNQSCNDYTYDDECWNTEVVEGNEPESVTISEELSPINESNTDIMSPLVVIHSGLCGSRGMESKSHEEVVQMQRDSQLHTTVCCDVSPTQILQDSEIKHGTTDCTFVFDKTHDLAPPINFVTPDGRLESIVYKALTNHRQKVASENTSSVSGQPDAAVARSPDVTDNCPSDEISLPSYAEQSLKNMNMLKSRVDYEICSNEGSGEVQVQLFEACVNKETASRVPSEISVAEETHEMLVGAPTSSAASLETENQNVTDIFDDDSIEHGPKTLFTKRKIMSPTSQEKLCNALTGIDLCGVKRQKSDVIVEDCEKSKILLPQPSHNQERSAFSTDRRLRGRIPNFPTSKEVHKSGETQSHKQSTCSCKKSSPVALDTEKAVEFSQRQMQDVENIAAKLIRSLKHMKTIVDETLSSEAYSGVPNYNIADIRAASEDASEVEKTTRKWLTMMNKDCNRFCKILTLAKKDVPAQQAPRKQRKITFADEAGGKLCHVKLFKDRSTSLSECQSDS